MCVRCLFYSFHSFFFSSFIRFSVENAKQKSDENRKLFRERYDAMQTNTHELLKNTSRRKWTCDKDNYPGAKSLRNISVSGHLFHTFIWNFILFSILSSATYYQITRFIQGYVDNEVNLNPDASCSQTCEDYTRTHNYDCQSGTLCGEPHIDRASTKCNGTILYCAFIDDDLIACPVSV